MKKIDKVESKDKGKEEDNSLEGGGGGGSQGNRLKAHFENCTFIEF